MPFSPYTFNHLLRRYTWTPSKPIPPPITNMSRNNRRLEFTMGHANAIMNNYGLIGEHLDWYFHEPGPEHLGEPKKRRNLERMIDSFVEDNIKTVRDAGNSVDMLINRDKFTEWMEVAYFKALANGGQFRAVYRPNWKSSGVGLVLCSPAKEWFQVLGGTCFPPDREANKCSGLHGPWTNSKGELVKFKATTDREVLAAALTAWHARPSDDWRTISESGEVTLTSHWESETIQSFTLSGGDASMTVSVEGTSGK